MGMFGGQTEFICVEPGPLPFADASFDIVTSKDSIIHIADKHALAVEIARIPEKIRGFGRVKERNLAAARMAWQELMQQWRAPAAGAPAAKQAVGA